MQHMLHKIHKNTTQGKTGLPNSAPDVRKNLLEKQENRWETGKKS